MSALHESDQQIPPGGEAVRDGCGEGDVFHATHSYYDGLGFRTVVYFVANPDEELTGADIAVKFDLPPRYSMSSHLRAPLKAGWLSVRRYEGPVKGGIAYVYSAGPELLKAIGR